MFVIYIIVKLHFVTEMSLKLFTNPYRSGDLIGLRRVEPMNAKRRHMTFLGIFSAWKLSVSAGSESKWLFHILVLFVWQDNISVRLQMFINP
jgi:hypothetical protein